MKAFIIKNKEGKYFDKEDRCFYEPDFTCCKHAYYTIDNAKHYIDYYGLKDCEPVEITIEEVNKNFEPQNYDNLSIEDKLKYRDEQVRLAVERSVDDYNKITDLEFHIKRLEEQLEEKDQEINILQQMAIIDMQTKEILELQVATIRKQVCDEIRNKVSVSSGMISSYEELLNFRKILDQIEQAKKELEGE